MNMTIADFLLARIAEDEAGARFAAGPGWVRPAGDSWRVSPARVLAECAAKRRIVKRCSAVDYAMPSTHLAHGILAELAAVYADHADLPTQRTSVDGKVGA